tara:strand:- start:450 stop:1766 length:1317 start_codon:yes stop_codon:yes gene_type:complete
MIDYVKDFYNRTTLIEKSFIILFSFFPISIILGNLIINIFLILILIVCLVDLSINKDFSFLNDKTLILLILFFFSLLINLYFSKDPIASLPRTLKILEIISLIILLKKIIYKYRVEFENIIFGFWALIFSILIIDIFFELIFSFNTFGFRSYMPGRISSFFGDELVVGSFFLGFVSIYIVRISNIYKMNFNLKLSILIIFLITISFLIGERANFIKFFLIALFIITFVIKTNIRFKFAGALIIVSTLFLFLNFNENIKYRYYSQQIENFITETKNTKNKESPNIFINTKDNIISFIKWTKYGAHYNTAYKIFLENPYFGVGIKQYRNESYKEKYRNEDYKWTNERITTHPHQIHFEFLSETGLFGYVSFLLFILTSLYLSINNYLKHKNFYQLVTILYISVSLLPLLPSGSFFSTYTSSLFWINYAIMVSYIRNSTKS